MEQISENTTMFWRVQNVIKYQLSTLKLLYIVAGASPGCAKKFYFENSRDWFHFRFRRENLACYISRIYRAVDIKLTESAETLNVYRSKF